MSREYFDSVLGTGVLSTSDGNGRVNSALYARPHVFDDDTVGFIMADRLSRANLQSNPHASYLFLEDGDGFSGLRLHLTRIREEHDAETIASLRRKKYSPDDENRVGQLTLVYFKVDQELPLLGAGPSG